MKRRKEIEAMVVVNGTAVAGKDEFYTIQDAVNWSQEICFGRCYELYVYRIHDDSLIAHYAFSTIWGNTDLSAA